MQACQPITAVGGYTESHTDTPLQTERSNQRLKKCQSRANQARKNAFYL